MKKVLSLIAAAALSFVLLMSCSDYDDETYKLEGIDKSAADLFSATVVFDTTRDDDSVVTAIDTLIIPEDTVKLYSKYELEFDSSATPTVAQLTAELNKIEGNSLNQLSHCYWAEISGSEESSIVFNKENSKKIIVYIDDYVDVEFWREKDGSDNVVQAKSNKIEQATIANCTSIKTRLEFNLEQGAYLMRIIADDKTVERNFRMVLIEK